MAAGQRQAPLVQPAMSPYLFYCKINSIIALEYNPHWTIGRITMTYIVSSAPVIVYLIVIKVLDGQSVTKWSKLLECFVWGLLSCVFCFLTVSSPLIEESVKVLPLFFAFHRGRSVFLSEGVLYGAAVGAGFALLENIFYISLGDYFTLGDAIVRGFGTSILHIGCTALSACLTLLLCRGAYKWKTWLRILISLFSLVPSFLLHYLYNRFLLPEYIQMAIIILVIMVMILFLYELDNRIISKWLDVCINNDIDLLKSIRDGQLRQTNAGRYLMAARDRFKPEMFFDICVYIGLYLEISVAAKSRMILKEAGMYVPLGEDEHKSNMDKITELACLRKQIGTAGLIFLAPIVDSRAVDDWVINEFL